jgi:hypothetical protein
MNTESGREFAVTEFMAAQNKQFSLPRWQRPEDSANASLLFGRGV